MPSMDIGESQYSQWEYLSSFVVLRCVPFNFGVNHEQRIQNHYRHQHMRDHPA